MTRSPLQLRRLGYALLLPERMNDKTDHSDTDAGVSHVKGRPRMPKGNGQTDNQKINTLPVKQPIGQIAEDTGEQQRKRNVAPKVSRPPERARLARFGLPQKQHEREEK